MNRGFIGNLILLTIGLALAYYFFDWSIFDAIKSDKGMATIDYIQDVFSASWSYIKTFGTKLYEIF